MHTNRKIISLGEEKLLANSFTYENQNKTEDFPFLHFSFRFGNFSYSDSHRIFSTAVVSFKK